MDMRINPLTYIHVNALPDGSENSVVLMFWKDDRETLIEHDISIDQALHLYEGLANIIQGRKPAYQQFRVVFSFVSPEGPRQFEQVVTEENATCAVERVRRTVKSQKNRTQIHLESVEPEAWGK